MSKKKNSMLLSRRCRGLTLLGLDISRCLIFLGIDKKMDVSESMRVGLSLMMRELGLSTVPLVLGMKTIKCV